MSDTGEGWQVARRRKGASKKCKNHSASSDSKCDQENLDVGQLVKRIKKTMSDLRCEEFWGEWKEQLLVAASTSLLRLPENNDTEDQLEEDRKDRVCQQLDCVCYGLGSFSTYVSARYQLAMLLLLLEAGQIPLQDCSVYDPAFSRGDMDVLRELGLTVLTENEEGKRLVTKPTLFYMMHCGKALYNNLLWRNWRAQCLSRVMIIGNTFGGMRERTLEREFKQDYRYISEAVDLCEERQLPCPSCLIDVFSDTALITFPSNSLNRLPQSSWTDSPEPQYQHRPDLEIILRASQS
ncbi:SRR1-like protein [Odontesthes bonariensis]|uniref:SRR1-like protein n=1 Tax=Odontesthes bonariensis TaxID=219752 RepID=UPI003F589558